MFNILSEKGFCSAPGLVAALALQGSPVAAIAAGLDLPGELGTPAQAEVLRKAMPALSAGNYHLGMAADTAVSQLKQDGLLASRMALPQVGIQFRQLPDHPLIGAAYGQRQAPGGTVLEAVGLLFTMYPSTPVVSSIARTTGYAGPSTAPSVANTLAALRSKYGPETGTFGQNTLTWLFDYQGRPLPAQQVAPLRKPGCLSFVGLPGNIGYPSAVRDFIGNKIANDYIESNGGLMNGERHDPACFRLLRVDAVLNISRPGGAAGFSGNYGYTSDQAGWAGLSDDLVQNLTVTIRDLALDYSAAVLTRSTVLAGGEQHARKQVREASRNTPQL